MAWLAFRSKPASPGANKQPKLYVKAFSLPESRCPAAGSPGLALAPRQLHMICANAFLQPLREVTCPLWIATEYKTIRTTTIRTMTDAATAPEHHAASQDFPVARRRARAGLRAGPR
jgi:hypothetical protein